MRNSILFIVILLGTILLSPFLPWWVIAPLSCLGTYVAKSRAGSAFLVPFLAVAIAWLASIYYLDDGSVQGLVGKIFEVPSVATPFIAAVLAGLVAGFFGLAGGLLSVKKKKWVNS